jgi:transposase
MEVLHPRCAGIDVSKRDAKVCVRVQGDGRRPTESSVTTWGATTRQVLALRDYLVAALVSAVVIESSGDYWKPFYYLLEADLNLVLVNAREAKTVPGRKTDVADAAWLADLGAHGLVRPSFVPPPAVRDLRDLTRSRAAVAREHSREVQRLEKLLEGAQIKLSSVATDLTGVSCRLILRAIAAGESDPERLADLAHGRLRRRRADLVEALTGQIRSSHQRLIGLHLDRLEALAADQHRIEGWIEEAMAPFLAARDLLITIPGINQQVANVVIAEIGTDMSVFPTAAHLCSWAGVAPGIHQSAGRTKTVKCRPGNTHLKAALGIAALAVSRSKGTFLAAKYRRLQLRRGKMKALVAVQRALLIAIWTLLTTGAEYLDPGADYYTRYDPQRRRRRAVRDLEALGYQVTIQPAA